MQDCLKIKTGLKLKYSFLILTNRSNFFFLVSLFNKVFNIFIFFIFFFNVNYFICFKDVNLLKFISFEKCFLFIFFFSMKILINLSVAFIIFFFNFAKNTNFYFSQFFFYCSHFKKFTIWNNLILVLFLLLFINLSNTCDIHFFILFDKNFHFNVKALKLFLQLRHVCSTITNLSAV